MRLQERAQARPLILIKNTFEFEQEQNNYETAKVPIADI